MDVEGFKYIFFWEWAHRILGRSIGFTFFLPMVYFWSRGYLQGKLKFTLLALLTVGGLQGAIGWWMVSSGLVDKHKTKEIDKTPRVSPYRLATHAGFAYSLYTVSLWQALNILRTPQESIVNSFARLAATNDMRTKLRRITFLTLPYVLVTGFFTAGTNAGTSCNTFPKVGSNWFYNSNHFLNRDEVPLWKNFTENKLICQVNHRTLASLMTLWVTYASFRVSRLNYLPAGAKKSIYFLVFALWMQMFIGMNVIWNSVPIWLASSHQFGAMTGLTAFIIAFHSCRRVDPRHTKNLLGKLKLEDKQAFDQMMKW
jgi:cytochrome c oxidase assembly protein subunit 15